LFWVFNLPPFCYGEFFFAAYAGDVSGIVDIWKIGQIEHGTPLLVTAVPLKQPSQLFHHWQWR
jgi:hypothetical protein